ncbi:minor capsid protein [Anoxybacillus flavithermus]|uniref:minor capsid protein n=1 Tax=Anoxybacillus flavithermus TaxID=33934 RepID=UPI001866AFAD|nr:minor capsid protein [Anoxybacillus flavithermus]MBE2926589.1 minor capsid protein [Anoxybacillus flavithermus]MBE2937460.1 minor capsid protein [Anoxybacillus flavithermus]MBE2945118.1 minor capsid protein [Anoxybacillus flavithermus]MBE2948110.1 minor capsid protein [Anoxybacillus flavithermus]
MNEKEFLKMVDELFVLSDKEHREVLKLYRKHRDNIKQLIAELFMKYGVDGKVNVSDIPKIERQIQEEIRSIAVSEVAIVTTILATVFAHAYYRTAYEIEKSIGVTISFSLLRKEVIDEIINFNWSGIPFSQRIWDNTNALVNALRTELYLGIQQGESIDKIAKRIDKQFNSKAFQSQRLIRTESARVISSAQEKIYAESGVVQKVQWVATLEENTCEQCARLDEKQFDIDDETKPSPPKHPNCRCCFIGVVEGYEPTKRKDNETKEVIEYQSYAEWTKKKGIQSPV